VIEGVTTVVKDTTGVELPGFGIDGNTDWLFVDGIDQIITVSLVNIGEFREGQFVGKSGFA